MKKFLPRTINNPQGFTLVELMVVIAIIAILSTIGYSVYAGVQGAARDGRRRSELTQIARSIESTKDPVTGVYGTYQAAQLSADFPQNTPTDAGYCFVGSTNTAPPTGTQVGGIPSTNGLATGTVTCPNNGGAAFTGGTTPTFTPAAAGTMTAIVGNTSFTGFKSWMVCASMEKQTLPYCVKSLTQ